ASTLKSVMRVKQGFQRRLECTCPLRIR
ncbi:hypothetical protein A2U01_0091809, partial [Trifolium medium]|nr:hypothetical protein [Trifolium medium]